MLKNDTAQTGRRERRKREKVERIVSAARRLFADQGYESTSTRAIAEAADVATGTVFVYFPEKRDLLIHLFREDLQRITDDGLAGIEEGTSLIDACMSIFEAAFDLYARDTALARSFVKEAMFLGPSEKPEIFNMTMHFLARVATLVQDAQARGEIDATIGPPHVAQQLFATYYWSLINWLGTGVIDREHVGLITRMNLEQLMRGLSPR